MEIPTHLKHRPIIKLENYDEIDGRFANDTDAKGLSVGVAQWNDGKHWESKELDISVKAWRHTEEKWSRQSEEIPPHRLVDMTSLLCSALLYCKDGNFVSDETFQVSSSRDSALLEILKKGLEREQPHLDNSLKRLSKMLKQLGY